MAFRFSLFAGHFLLVLYARLLFDILAGLLANPGALRGNTGGMQREAAGRRMEGVGGGNRFEEKRNNIEEGQGRRNGRSTERMEKKLKDKKAEYKGKSPRTTNTGDPHRRLKSMESECC